ncbi:Uncharacterized protein Rs2_24243 [Raphanus sativus]|nr:Uncharacterized protein Rs2_24243 [Raphanus sativus]
MVSISIYPILDESPFVEREENHEIYREIYGDPIYDIYEDDVCVVRAKFGRDEFCAKFGRNDFRAKSGRDEFRAKYGQNHIDEDFVKNIDNLMRANFVQTGSVKIHVINRSVVERFAMSVSSVVAARMFLAYYVTRR